MLDPLYVGDIITSTLHGSPFPQTHQATSLLLGIGAVESEFLDRAERGQQQGVGYFQLTPDLEVAIWTDYLCYNVQLMGWFASHAGQQRPNPQSLEYNLSYQILLMRAWFYWQDKESLPDAEKVDEQARHWRTYWRQSEDRGMEAAYIEAYKRLVVPHYPLHRVRKGG